MMGGHRLFPADERQNLRSNDRTIIHINCLYKERNCWLETDFKETLDCVGVQLMDLKYHNRFESIHMATNSNRSKLDSHLNTLGSLDLVLNLNRFILLSYWNIGKDELAMRIRRSTFWRQSTIDTYKTFLR